MFTHRLHKFWYRKKNRADTLHSRYGSPRRTKREKINNGAISQVLWEQKDIHTYSGKIASMQQLTPLFASLFYLLFHSPSCLCSLISGRHWTVRTMEPAVPLIFFPKVRVGDSHSDNFSSILYYWYVDQSQQWVTKTYDVIFHHIQPPFNFTLSRTITTRELRTDIWNIDRLWTCDMFMLSSNSITKRRRYLRVVPIQCR
jgi:hypothetical protein